MLQILQQYLENKKQYIKTCGKNPNSGLGVRTEKEKEKEGVKRTVPIVFLLWFSLSLGNNSPFFCCFSSTHRLFSDVLLTNSEKPQFKVELNIDLLMFVEVSGCG